MKTLKKFEFPTFGGRSQYDWDTLLDGRIFHLEQGDGKDFSCTVGTFRAIAARQAANRKRKLRAAKVEGGLVIQALPDPNASANGTVETPAGEPAAQG